MNKSNQEMEAIRITCSLAVEIFRINTSSARDRTRFGMESSDTLLLASVMIGTIDGRHMTAAKLADYAGIPRPTVVRRLEFLVSLGLVQALPGRRFAIPPQVALAPSRRDALKATIKAIHAASAALSKLDT